MKRRGPMAKGMAVIGRLKLRGKNGDGGGRASRAAATEARVIYQRGEEGWAAWIADHPELAARGGSLAQARKRMRAVMSDAGFAATTRIAEEVRLPRAGRDAMARLERARAALDEAERDAVAVLVREVGLTTADASAALGITMRKVVHLAGEVADVAAERKYSRRPAAPKPVVTR
jgi:hypothetical protein